MKSIRLSALTVALLFLAVQSNVHGQDTLQILPMAEDTLTLPPKQLSDSNVCCNHQFNFENRSAGNKFLRGTGYSFLYSLSIGLYLVVAPPEITQWYAENKFQLPVMQKQYKKTFTSPPVIDHDLWVVNYIGHPYQGSYYYNAIRSQGGTLLQSSLHNLFQSLFWEYVWEGGVEQPSIQDLIVTPVAGSLLGEFTHKATLSMRKNGFRWYEKVAVCLINPAYAINNRFSLTKRRK